MKRISFNRLFALLLLPLWMGACSAEGIGDTGEDPAGTRSIGWLKAQCRGESTLIRNEWVIRGRIVANDAYGEWSRALVVADQTGGITLYADASSLADRYPFGASVVLYANGLRLYNYGGKIVLGAATPTDYGFGIPSEAIASHLHRAPDAATAPEPATIPLADLGAAQVDTYVRVTGVRFAQPGRSWCDRDLETGRHIATEHTLLDEAGHAFTVRTIGSCIYAQEPLPSGKGSLCGVIDCFNGKYTLRVVNREIDFDQLRFGRNE